MVVRAGYGTVKNSAYTALNSAKCSVAVLGTGRVAGGVLDAMPHDVEVGAFHVWGRDRGRAERMARTADRSVSIHVHDTPASAAAQADVVVTCTRR